MKLKVIKSSKSDLIEFGTLDKLNANTNNSFKIFLRSTLTEGN